MEPSDLLLDSNDEHSKNYNRSVGKLLKEGMTPQQVYDHRNELIASNGKLVSGWGGVAAAYANAATEKSAYEMAEMEMGMQLEAAREMARLNYELTQEGIEANLERFPRVSGMGLEHTRKQTVELNDLMQGEYEDALDEYYPDWRTDILGAAGEAQADSVSITKRFRETILPGAIEAANRMSEQAIGNAEAMLRGELPDDVAAQVKRHAAELSNQIGVRGQAAQYLTGRDLGRTSLDLMQQGLADAPAALSLGANAYLGLNSVLQAPVKTGMDVSNLVKSYLPQQVDPASLFSSNLGVLAGASTIPAASLMGTTANVMHSGASLAADAFGSALEYQSQQYWNRQNLNMQKQALDAQKSANMMNFVSSLIGAGVDAYAGYKTGKKK